jgi:hypothetical protein
LRTVPHCHAEDGETPRQTSNHFGYGGLLRLARTLSGDFVEGLPQGGGRFGEWPKCHLVRAASDASLRLFRFVALGDDDHRTLRMAVVGYGPVSGHPIQPVVAPKPS